MPYRITVIEKDFYDYINCYNGKKRLFSSVYNYTGNFEYDRIALKVDKVFFDFDGDDCLKNVWDFVNECIKNDYKFITFFSGAGFHVYVFTTAKHLDNPKLALTRFQMMFSGMDRTSIGDVARVATIPNTYNTKRGRFCIPVTLGDLSLGYEHIRELATEQRYDIQFYGDTLVDLSTFDGPEEERHYHVFDEPRVEIEEIKELPPCINDLLSYEKKGFRGRFLIIVYLKDAGYLENQIEDIIRKYCAGKEAEHCIKEERQVKYLYWKDIMFPSCDQMKCDGRCPVVDFCEFTRPYGNKHLVKIYK